MRQSRQGVHWIGLLVGLTFSLGAAVLSAAPPTMAVTQQAGYVGNRNSKIFHKLDCSALRRSSIQNQVPLAGLQIAVSQGFNACQICKPDQDQNQGAALAVASQGATPGGTPKEDDGPLQFSKDIAPILAGNCLGCHNTERSRGEFDLSTFQNMMKGSQSGQVIVPGNPDESLLVELVVSRQMPRGGNDRRLADVSIEKISRWVQEGARLDSGVSPSELLSKIAPSADQMRRSELAKLSPQERDERLEATAIERWKQAGAQDEPEMESGKNFAIFSRLPEARAKATLKGLENQRTRLGTLLGPEHAQVLAGPEKVSVYVFNDLNTFAEFLRAIERREIEEGTQAVGRLDVESPYLVVIDPLAGGEESQPSSRSRDDDDLGSPDRSLLGLLSQELGKATVQSAGRPPAWLAEGLGAYLALQVETKSPYYNDLRRETAQQFQLGWPTKATEALGDQASPDALRALGFSMFEWLGSSFRQQFPVFVRSVVEDGGRGLDNIIKNNFGPNVTRDQFVGVWGQWVAQNYGRFARRR